MKNTKDLLAILMLLFLSLTTGGIGAYAQHSPPPLPDTAVEAVMAVVAGNQTGGNHVATAFHVGSGRFYTNAHVIRNAEAKGLTQFFVASTTSRPTPADFLRVKVECIHGSWQDPHTHEKSYPFDVAQLQASPAAILPPALALSAWAAVEGQHVRIIGFPIVSQAWPSNWPPKQHTAMGRVEVIYASYRAFSISVESGTVLGGSSGSPVLNEAGEVVGILFAGDSSTLVHAATVQAIQTVCER